MESVRSSTEIVETEEEMPFGCADAILQFQSAALNTRESRGKSVRLILDPNRKSCKLFALCD
jgi:hypothetical protein